MVIPNVRRLLCFVHIPALKRNEHMVYVKEKCPVTLEHHFDTVFVTCGRTLKIKLRVSPSP